MELETVIFWFVLFSCVGGLLGALRNLQFAGGGWLVLLFAILTLLGFGKLKHFPPLIYASGIIWALFVLLPNSLAKIYNARVLQQRYNSAYRWAWMIKLLHPFDGWREQPRIIRALGEAQKGNFDAAVATLKTLTLNTSAAGISAIVSLFRITNEWEGFFAWLKKHEKFATHPQSLPVVLRALGETGNVRGLVELYDSNSDQIPLLTPASTRHFCVLMLFAFCGRRELVERILAGPLATLPDTAKRFWLATADLYAGFAEQARVQFEALLPDADPPTRLAIGRRLQQLNSARAPLGPEIDAVVRSAAVEQSHEETFGANVSLFSKAAIGTVILMIANLAMFAVEVRLGGSTDRFVLNRLGALWPPAVQGGDWWRPLSALFLHFGPVHLAMNMMGLWILGPFVEFALGFRRFFALYLLAGVGSMLMVMVLSGDQWTVGASGAVMSLVGATAALMLRGWLREKAEQAKRRLIGALLVVVFQVIFDSMEPRVSSAAHMTGLAFGFLIAMFLKDRLKPKRS